MLHGSGTSTCLFAHRLVDQPQNCLSQNTLSRHFKRSLNRCWHTPTSRLVRLVPVTPPTPATVLELMLQRRARSKWKYVESPPSCSRPFYLLCFLLEPIAREEAVKGSSEAPPFDPQKGHTTRRASRGRGRRPQNPNPRGFEYGYGTRLVPAFG